MVTDVNKGYDPDIGRFISEDPLGPILGGTNLYAYVLNNPLRWTDPWGLIEQYQFGSDRRHGVYDNTTLESWSREEAYLRSGILTAGTGLGATIAAGYTGPYVAGACMANPAACVDILSGLEQGLVEGIWGEKTGLPPSSPYEGISNVIGSWLGENIRNKCGD